MAQAIQGTGRWWALCAVGIAACGGSTAATLEAGAPEGGPSIDAGRDATTDAGQESSVEDSAAIPDATPDASPAPLCPAFPPEAGAPCDIESLTCEYGTSFDPLCNTAYQCSRQRWSLAYNRQFCHFTGANDPKCPATFADVPRDGGCAGPLDCDYPEGRCLCTTSCGGGRPLPDASSTWICGSTAPGCPNPRGTNRLGTPCATPGLSCGYGVCCGGTYQSCGDAGVWEGRILEVPCP